MYFYNKYVYQILDCYRTHLETVDTQSIGFTGTASEQPAPVLTSSVSADTLWFAGNVNFINNNVLVRIKSISPQYDWMSNNLSTPQDTPIGAVFGFSSQALPVLPLIQPFFVEENGKLQMQFTNSSANPTTGGNVTWRLLKLSDPIQQSDGTYGWSYQRGFRP